MRSRVSVIHFSAKSFLHHRTQLIQGDPFPGLLAAVVQEQSNLCIGEFFVLFHIRNVYERDRSFHTLYADTKLQFHIIEGLGGKGC